MAPHSGLHYKGFRRSLPTEVPFHRCEDRPPQGTESARSPLHTDAFCLLRIKISTNVDAFIPLSKKPRLMRLRPEGPRIAVPNWLIEWSKSRDLFLTLAHNPWVFRPN
jgi:hypothetical protein